MFKLICIALALVIASPAMAAHKKRQAPVTRSIDDPVLTGGGSQGYNEMVRTNQGQ